MRTSSRSAAPDEHTDTLASPSARPTTTLRVGADVRLRPLRTSSQYAVKTMTFARAATRPAPPDDGDIVRTGRWGHRHYDIAHNRAAMIGSGDIPVARFCSSPCRQRGGGKRATFGCRQRHGQRCLLRSAHRFACVAALVLSEAVLVLEIRRGNRRKIWSRPTGRSSPHHQPRAAPSLTAWPQCAQSEREFTTAVVGHRPRRSAPAWQDSLVRE